MKTNISNVMQKGYVVFVFAFIAALLVPALANKVSAGQVVSRFVKISDSTQSATGVTYEMSFKPTVTTNIGGIVLDICSNTSTPIVGDTTCGYATGFDFGGSGTPTFNIVSGIGTGGSWVSTNSLQGGAAAGKVQVFVLTNATPQAPTGTSTPIVIDITGVTNTSTLGTFYGRILTFDTAAHTTSEYTASGTTRAASFTDMIDYGGVALSTAAVITVTAKVQEQLTFCLYTGANCAAGGTAVALGNTQGVLSTSGAYVDKTTKYDIQTNASGNAIVNVKGATLTSGSNTIAAINSGSGAAASTPGTSQFGLCTYESSGSNLTANANYIGTNGGNDCTSTTQTAGTGSTGGDGGSFFDFRTQVQGTYGDTISSASAGPSSTGRVVFLGNTSVTQTAGIYTTSLIFIATGTY